MGILRGIWRLLCKVLAAAIGITAAVALFSGFMVIKVEGSSMLPTLEPGQRVIINKLDTQDFSVGDLVVYKAPYYSIDGQGQYLIRRVVGVKDNWIKVGCEMDMVATDTEIIEKDIVLGKVMEICYGEERT